MSRAGSRDPALPARPRRTELALLLAALVLLALGFASAEGDIRGQLSGTVALYAGALAGAALALHTALRFLAPWADPLILPLATVLNGVGLCTIWGLHRVSDPRASEAADQLTWTLCGIALCGAALAVVPRPRMMQRYPYLTAAAGLVLLTLPMLPFVGIDAFGAQRWIGVAGFTVQPSEFAKILLVVFLAAYLSIKRDVLSLAARQLTIGSVKVFSQPRMRDLGPMTVAWGVAILLLVGTKDLGTSLLLFGVYLAMLYTATQRKSWVGIGVAMFAAGACVAWALFGHVQRRVTAWLTPFAPDTYEAEGGSFQLVQGLFALAEGGLTGTGFGQGRAADIFASDSDLILVSIGEKLGFTGLAAVVVLLFLLTERGFRAALESREIFVKLATSGFAFLLAFQVFVVLGGVTRLIPLTGMTTPFLAAGGSSLVSSWIIVGLWLRISDAARRPEPAAEHGADAATEVLRLRSG
ncbi:cell elongation-specific peptidoglycan biosynthesis regulator RodA [Haloactinospora alba]|uniref:Cell elongation-specific peptidoglycan biosynthesis regulator RodA n=1 Tax=Haloactinospora alba TaxID=405555 RepID=A0A543NES4_9ACTN|nr:FtsW/RodA/SpoVE family cell cycle protein [Haloactinospora alba]TQN30344.1 cell elongation-specific peptidoglycan biosynthesis regulator RodA [Haloactinospora alba]